MHYKSPPCPWHAVLCFSWSFPNGGHCQTLLCIQCLVGFIRSWGHTANNSLHPPQLAPRLLQFRPCRHHEHYKYSRWYPVPPNSYQPKSRLLPEKVNTHYQLRPRQHDRQLIPKTTKLYSCNFVIRMLYKHSYWLYFIVHSLTVLITFVLLLSYIVQVAFWQLDIKRRWWWWWWWWCLAVGLACGDQRRLTGNGSALEMVLHDDAL